jgi:hypothetical protein
MLIGVLEEIGNEHIQGSILGQTVWNAEKATADV